MCLKRIVGFFKDRKSESIHFAVLVVLGVLSFFLYTNLEVPNPIRYLALAYLIITSAFPFFIGSIIGVIYLFFSASGLRAPFGIHFFVVGASVILAWILEFWYVSKVFAGYRRKEQNAKKKLITLIVITCIIAIITLQLYYHPGVFNFG